MVKQGCFATWRWYLGIGSSDNELVVIQIRTRSLEWVWPSSQGNWWGGMKRCAQLSSSQFHAADENWRHRVLLPFAIRKVCSWRRLDHCRKPPRQHNRRSTLGLRWCCHDRALGKTQYYKLRVSNRFLPWSPTPCKASCHICFSSLPRTESLDRHVFS